jgi:branched-chain amino acid transport system substrate-binding protein
MVEILRGDPGKGSSGAADDVGLAERLIRTPSLVGVVGHLSSRASLIVGPIYGEAGIPLVVPTASSRLLRSLGPWVFPLAPDEQAEGEFIAAFVVDRLGARRVTLVHLLADEYGIGLRDGVLAGLRKRGVEPVDQAGILADSDAIAIVAASLARATPDAVVVAARNRETRPIVEAFHARVPGMRIIAGDGVVLSSGYARALGTSASSLYAAAFWHPDLPSEVSRGFVARCRAALGFTPSEASAMFYDGFMVLAEAVKEVGPRREAIRQYLTALGGSRPPFSGVTGPICFGATRRTNLVMTGMPSGVPVIVD